MYGSERLTFIRMATLQRSPFFREQNGSYMSTDLGETLGWLRTQTVAQKKSPKQRQLIADVCLNHGVELFRGMLTARLRNPANLTERTL